MMQHRFFPAETLQRKLRAVLSGNKHILIEQHRGLAGYTEDCVTVRLENGFLRVRGKN